MVFVAVMSLYVLPAEASAVSRPDDWKEPPDMVAMLDRVGDDAGLPRGLSHVLAYGESRFHPGAVSKDGRDRGLCQLGRQWELDLVWRYFRNKDGTPRTGFDWRNPEHNAVVGCGYLSDLTRRFGGSLYLGMVAYNWGPGHVARMQKWSDIPRRTIRYVDQTMVLLDSWEEEWGGER
jgi:soluble lytic murein transglycosylase-like protein